MSHACTPLEDGAKSATRPCPVCQAAIPADHRHPRSVCPACVARAVDAQGASISFGNEGLSGGLVASRPSTPVVDGQAACYIDGIPCVAEEGRFGGVVVQATTGVPDLCAMSATELLFRHSAILDELLRRGILRSRNNPTGDYGEWLVASRLGLTLADPSAKGFDATGPDGRRYQIKARRVSATKGSTQLGVIRNLAGRDFDVLVAVLYDARWRVLRAARIPHAVVHAVAKYRSHVNGHVMHLTPSLMRHDGVEDITGLLQSPQGRPA